MSARQILNVTYAYLCGQFGDEQVDRMLEGKGAAADAAANRQAVSALEELARMPRAGMREG